MIESMNLKSGMASRLYTQAFHIGGMQRYAWEKLES